MAFSCRGAQHLLCKSLFSREFPHPRPGPTKEVIQALNDEFRVNKSWTRGYCLHEGPNGLALQ